jgi:hypothetical protein
MGRKDQFKRMVKGGQRGNYLEKYAYLVFIFTPVACFSNWFRIFLPLALSGLLKISNLNNFESWVKDSGRVVNSL